MRLGNPLRDETAAFHLVLLALCALAVLVLAARVAPLLGVVVLVLELLALAWLVRDEVRRRRAERAAATPPRADVSDTEPHR
jgi:Flp pilus assembly protein TadB